MLKVYRLSAVLVVALAATAGAVPVYVTSFENPPFVPGSINNQDGWVNGSGTGQSQAIVDTFARTGTQSLRWDNTGSLSSFYSVRHAFDGQAGAITPATPLELSVWMYIEPTSQLNRLYGLYATNSGIGTLGSTVLGITISGTGDVRAGTSWSSTYSGPVLYTNAGLVGAWAKVLLRYDGTGGSAAVYDSASNLLWSTAFTTVNLSNANGTGVNSWNINLGTDYVTTTNHLGMAYMDDLSVVVVPEPAALLLLTLGGLALRRR
jgi:hypothetical protein